MRNVRWSKFFCIGAAVGLTWLCLPSPKAHAAVVERVVAVVGEQPILLTELRQRLRRFLPRILGSVPPAQQGLAIQEMTREMLGQMIDHRIVAMAADNLKVTVSNKDVEEAIKLKAIDMNMSITQLLNEAQKQGLSESDYREEVRREMLFGKMMETRVRSRVKPTEDDVREHYRKVVIAERRGQSYRASVITLSLGSGEESLKQRRLADRLVKQARQGVNFADLARQHSIDSSKELGGDQGTRMHGSVAKSLDEALLRLDVGQVSEPITVGETIVIYKISERATSRLPTYDQVRDKIFTLVREEQLQKQVRSWIDELKRGVYIDIRLL